MLDYMDIDNITNSDLLLAAEYYSDYDNYSDEELETFEEYDNG